MGKRVVSELQMGSGSVMDYARSIVPADDSSLQWSPVGSGITDDAQKTLNALFLRMVTQYDDDVAREHKSDEEVGKRFRVELTKSNMPNMFKPQTIVIKQQE